jgi:hypothetical protein
MVYLIKYTNANQNVVVFDEGSGLFLGHCSLKDTCSIGATALIFSVGKSQNYGNLYITRLHLLEWNPINNPLIYSI